MNTPVSPLEIAEKLNLRAIPESFVVRDQAACLLAEKGRQKELLLLAERGHSWLDLFAGEASEWGSGLLLKRCPTSTANAGALREVLPWLRPMPLGLHTSAGFGDRIGLATPGHVRALSRADPDHRLAPIFAQQSRREMDRGGRSPAQVMADTTWGAFAAGWRDGPLGADADHLKTIEDIDLCAAAGFTFFTLDPGSFVDTRADRDDAAALRQKAQAFPHGDLESTPKDTLHRYVRRTIDLEGRKVILEEADLFRAMVKYGPAIAQVVRLSRHLDGLNRPYDLEISVDETDTPTTHVEHIYIASELNRLGVRWVSLAPRFVGRFEKGVDYLAPSGIPGDLSAFLPDVQGHAAIARKLGPYKLSLHSGSDKFSIYPAVQEATRGLVHLKTAGTSYLEALRVIACLEPDLFRRVCAVAREHFEEDRASYHISAALSDLPDLDAFPDAELPSILDRRGSRQALHVTFGSVISALPAELTGALLTHAEAYAEGLAVHFSRHILPFTRS